MTTHHHTEATEAGAAAERSADAEWNETPSPWLAALSADAEVTRQIETALTQLDWTVSDRHKIEATYPEMWRWMERGAASFSRLHECVSVENAGCEAVESALSERLSAWESVMSLAAAWHIRLRVALGESIPSSPLSSVLSSQDSIGLRSARKG